VAEEGPAKSSWLTDSSTLVYIIVKTQRLKNQIDQTFNLGRGEGRGTQGNVTKPAERKIRGKFQKSHLSLLLR